MWQRPGDDGVALLVVGVAGLQLPLGGGGAVADSSSFPFLLVVVLQFPRLASVFQTYTLSRSFYENFERQC